MNNNEVMDDLLIDNEAVFEQLFKKHFRELHAYAFSLLRDWDVAEEIVQAMFLKLWERDEAVQVRTSIKSYLYKSVYHGSLNYLRGQKVQLKYQTTTAYSMKDHTDDAAEKLTMSELERHLQQALSKLPEKCRAIFHLSRFEELKYQEIANQLNISIKTVETHMGKALRILRKEMKEFLPIIALMLFNMFRS
jgi:RNA polymerase sigma-70 factor (ECF subfamily)